MGMFQREALHCEEMQSGFEEGFFFQNFFFVNICCGEVNKSIKRVLWLPTF